MLDSVEVLYNKQKFEEASALAHVQIQRAEKAFGRVDTLVEQGLSHLAVLCYYTGKYSEGIPYATEAIDICLTIKGKEHPDYGSRLNDLAILYESMGQFDKALPLSLEALENFEKSLGKAHTSYGVLLNNLANLYESMGQYDQALRLSLEAIENCEKSLGKAHSNYGIQLSNLANLYKNMGQYDKALPLQLEALENIEKSLGKAHTYYGICLNSLASLYQRMSQYDKALPLQLEAQENTEKSLGKAHSTYGGRLNNLAGLYRDMGQYKKALPLALEAMENIEKSLGKAHSYYGVLLSSLAVLYYKMGQYDKALPLYLEALENTEKSLGKAHSIYGSRLNNLADLYHNMGQYEKALPLFLEAMQNTEKSLGKAHYDYGTYISNLAGLYKNMGQYDKALPLYLELSNNRFTQINRNFSVLSEQGKENFLKTLNKNIKSSTNFLVDYASQNPSTTEPLFDLELTLKGLVLQSGISVRNTILESKDSVALATYENWQMYGNLVNKEYEKPINKRNTSLKEWEEKKESAEMELSRLSTTFRDNQSITQLRWKDIKQNLSATEAAIEFLSYESGPDSALIKHYAALVVRQNSDLPLLVKLSSEQQLKDLLSPPPGNPLEQVNHIYGSMKAPNTALYQAIWQPLEQALQGAKTVYYAPSGLLHKVSFAALSPAPGTYLGERYELRQVGSTGVVTRKKENSISATDRFLLAGGIQYNSDTTSIKFWSYLPGTLEESKGISNTLSSKKHSVKQLLGKEASEASFKEEAPKAEVLHIATHGYFFPDLEQEKETLKKSTKSKGEVLAFRGDTEGWIGNSLYANWNFVQNSNPMRRSGLALAYANDVWTRGLGIESEDGVLTAQELSNTDLRKAKLVVLSACETGLGDIKGSEGVFGLQRGLKQAGAGSLIMSLWRVPDKETSEFMQVFYSNLLSMKDIRQAFVFTQKTMQKKYAPYYWAAFVLVE
jgi:CHAT domain-containing protein/predicted O-linked N-acetylglucosamine transferase (SPINDLY family)